jgi:hypothetical protein
MKLRPAMVWLMIIALILGLVGVGWSAFRVTNIDINDQSQAVVTCDDLRAFIIAEEAIGLKNWKIYHKKVIQYAQGVGRSERAELVKELARDVTVVLKSDLLIYKEMKRSPQCVTVSSRDELNEWIRSTRETIKYLNGEIEIAKGFFDAEKGIWDQSFYDIYYSATDYLSTGLTEI